MDEEALGKRALNALFELTQEEKITWDERHGDGRRFRTYVGDSFWDVVHYTLGDDRNSYQLEAKRYTYVDDGVYRLWGLVVSSIPDPNELEAIKELEQLEALLEK